jgi:hypothetical protein
MIPSYAAGHILSEHHDIAEEAGDGYTVYRPKGGSAEKRRPDDQNYHAGGQNPYAVINS